MPPYGMAKKRVSRTMLLGIRIKSNETGIGEIQHCHCSRSRN
jgi:hypothetical protein